MERFLHWFHQKAAKIFTISDLQETLSVSSDNDVPFKPLKMKEN
jgi:hypothetical protein